jgi:hypothetical protein
MQCKTYQYQKQMKIYNITLLITSILISLTMRSVAQVDTLWLLSGKQIVSAKIVASDSLGRIYYVTEKGKTRDVSYDEAYSLRIADAANRIFYHPDTIRGEELDPAQMFDYIRGEHEALKQSSVGKFWTGIGIGAGSVVLMPLIGLPTYTSPIIAGGTGIFVSRMQKDATLPEGFNNTNNYFKEGYNYGVQKKRSRSLLIGVGVGLVAGFAVTLSTR